MKFFKRLFIGVATISLVILGFLVATNSTPNEALAAVNRNLALPVFWADNSGSNAFGLSASAVPTLTRNGIVYTGASTNIQYLHGTAATNTLVFINGVLYQRQ